MKRRQKVLNETMPNVDQIDISLFSNNHGHKHLTFPFVGGSWMYILLMMSKKERDSYFSIYDNNVLDRTAALPGGAAVSPRGFKDGVQTDLVTKLDFQKESSPSLLTSKTIIGTKKFVCLDSLK